MTQDIYSIYKKLLWAVIIFAVLMGGLTAAFMIFYRIPSLSDNRNAAVKELERGTIESSYAGLSEQGAAASAVPSSGAAPAAQADASSVPEPSGMELFLDSTSPDTDYLWIPVEEGITSADIMIENHYVDHQLWVAIMGGNSDFYAGNYVSGDLSGVVRGEADDAPDRLILKFTMDRVYEYDTIFENGVLYVETRMPRELYGRIVVVDPAGYVPEELIVQGSADPAVICQDVAAKVQAGLEADGVRVYVTSADGRVASDEASLSLASDVRPDMYVRIETSYDEDSREYGTMTVYNGTYFIPGFGSVELADLLEAHVTTAIGGKARGLVMAGESDVVISGSTVPAATIKVGYYTNSQENILLNRDDYRTRIAEGILAAVREAYGED